MKRNAIEKYRYMVLAAPSQEDLDEFGASYKNEWDTLKDARKNAKSILTNEFNSENQCNLGLGYSRVIEMETGDCINDYSR